MTAITQLDDEELYLAALLDDPSGIDLAEFCWIDEEAPDSCWRVWDFQHAWYRNTDIFQIDQCARSLGKSVGVQMRAFAFPFNYAGQEMLITAPELNHLRPLTDMVEGRLLSTRLARELLPNQKGLGIARQPAFQVRFANGARIISRLPNKDGKGIKGQHPLVLEGDEMQDYPEAGWVELIETLKRGSVGAQWRCHGVSRGVRDRYYKQTQPDSGWTVHRYMAMHRPTWTDTEREEKLATYGSSRDNPDYKRNIYGEHGDATNPLFVLARLMACVDMDPGYNEDLYQVLRVSYELLDKGGVPIEQLLELPGSHHHGYSAYWAGMDVGFTNHPSEILVFGQLPKGEKLRLLTRVHLERIDARDQMRAITHLFGFYGEKLKAFALDKTGNGLPIWQMMLSESTPSIRDRIKGYNFSAKYAVGFADRELEGAEIDPEDAVIEKNIVEYSSDKLREYVDSKLMELPFDRELLGEWQGQSYTIVKTTTNPYGKRSYSQGKFHTLDAARMMIAAKTLEGIEAALARVPDQPAVLDQFMAVGY